MRFFSARCCRARGGGVDSYLDLGCGTGHMLARVHARFRPSRVTAVDHSEGMLAQARELEDLDKVESLQFIHSDLLAFLGSCDEIFDLISCVGVLHHLRLEEIDQVFDLCRSRAATGGRLLIAEPIDAHSLHHPPRWLQKWNGRSWAAKIEYAPAVEEPDEHPLPEGFLLEALQRTGWNLRAQRRGVEVFPHNDPPSLLDKLIAKVAQWPYRKTGYVHAVLAQVG